MGVHGIISINAQQEGEVEDTPFRNDDQSMPQ
jgi:hypothetical protein